MAMTREQVEQYVDAMERIQKILDTARGVPAKWLEQRNEFTRLVAVVDRLSEAIEPIT